VSAVTWEEDAVRLEGTADTQTWTMLTREVPVEGATWVELRVRMRTEEVQAQGQRFVNCNAFVKHPQGLVPTRILTGTQPWTELRRQLAIPPGTSTVAVGLFCSLPGRTWFDEVSLSAVDPPAWKDRNTAHYRYRTLGDETIDAKAEAFNAESFTTVAAFLGVDGPVGGGLVEYRKYPDLETKEALSGRPGNAHREGNIIHSIWATDRHEIVHVLGDGVGDPPALIAEGLAVHLSGGWQGGPVRAAAAKVLEQGEWPGLEKLLTSVAFRNVPDLVSYPVSGAFVAWIIETKGKDTLLELYRSMKNGEPEAESRAKLESTLGAPLEQLDGELQAWVSSKG
jgi:hypothetical protein